MQLRLFIWNALAFVLVAPTAHARCDGMVALAAIHDAYLAAYSETGAIQNRGAVTLLFLLGGKDVDRFLKQLERSGTNIQKEQLSDALADAETLARLVLETGDAPASIEQDRAHVSWLGHVIRRSRCQKSAASASPGPRLVAGSRWTGSPGKQTEKTLMERLGREMTGIVIAIGLTAAIILGYLGFRVWISAAMRRARVERLPRRPISLGFDLTYTDADGNMGEAKVTALDISSGGLKLDWPDPPPLGTSVTLNLITGISLAQVAWSNDYFAGVMLDSPLSKADLQTLQDAGANAERNGDT